MTILKELKDKIVQRKAEIGIIGLGYVGLPLAVEFAEKGFRVIGIDVDPNRVEQLNKGRSYISDIETRRLRLLVEKKRLGAVTDHSLIKDLHIIIICVPTPLRKTKEPDLSYVMDAVGKVARYIKKGQLIILESTTYPGTTEEIILPLLNTANLKVGEDFFLAFSPERIDPANKIYTTKNIPKVVGGVTPNCTEISRLLYEQIINSIIPVSSPRLAEMVKLLESTFRIVNIGMINELALMCNKLGIDVWEVIEAARTKPFGFIPFYPGPGLGGHCIGVDPIYLSWKARLHGFEARFIDLASQINSYMPHYVVERVGDVLNEEKKSIKGSRILILGVAYKRDVNDTRESPAIEIIRSLTSKGAQVAYHDPLVPRVTVDDRTFSSIKLDEGSLKDNDCVVIVTDHTAIDYELIARNANLILDTRNALRDITKNRDRIIKL